MEKSDKKTVGIFTTISAFIAGLCCFSPVILVWAGLATTSFASSLADTLYGTYKWYFRLAGILFLALSYFWWYKTKSRACDINEKQRLKKKALNLFLITLIISIIAYIIWLYGIVEFIGIQMGLWENPYT